MENCYVLGAEELFGEQRSVVWLIDFVKEKIAIIERKMKKYTEI
jgi:hypothetical protein